MKTISLGWLVGLGAVGCSMASCSQPAVECQVEVAVPVEEIELEIDALPSVVLQRLYNFVVRPLKATTKVSNAYKVPKRNGSGNTGRTGSQATGGVKRKSMDEAAEAEKFVGWRNGLGSWRKGMFPPPLVSVGRSGWRGGG